MDEKKDRGYGRKTVTGPCLNTIDNTNTPHPPIRLRSVRGIRSCLAKIEVSAVEGW